MKLSSVTSVVDYLLLSSSLRGVLPLLDSKNYSILQCDWSVLSYICVKSVQQLDGFDQYHLIFVSRVFSNLMGCNSVWCLGLHCLCYTDQWAVNWHWCNGRKPYFEVMYLYLSVQFHVPNLF